MRILIIGCGYIGLAVGRRLHAQGHEIVALRRDPPSDPCAAPASGWNWLRADISRPELLPSTPPPADVVVHCVATSGGTVEDYRRTYLEGTRHVLDWLCRQPPASFIYTSSTGVYGQTDGSWVDEESAAAPASPTARVLVETEQVLREAARERRFPAVILRLSGIYGPGRGYWLKQFMAGEARLEGDGGRMLNMIHRDDVVGAVEAAWRAGKPGGIYNVTDNAPVTQREMFEWLAARLHRSLPAAIPAEAATTRRRGLTHKRISNRRLREELAYTLRFPTFREGFEAELQRLGGIAG